jgi:hypothetical protein
VPRLVFLLSQDLLKGLEVPLSRRAHAFELDLALPQPLGFGHRELLSKLAILRVALSSPIVFGLGEVRLELLSRRGEVTGQQGVSLGHSEVGDRRHHRADERQDSGE